MKIPADVIGSHPNSRDGWLKPAAPISWLKLLELRSPEELEERRRKSRPGSTPLEQVIRFVSWAQQRHTFPSPRDIHNAFGVSRATAYRWRNALADAYGVIPPPCNREEAMSS